MTSTDTSYKIPESTVDKHMLFERIGYIPHSEEQWLIHNSTARFKIPCCGRRFGKSQAAGHEFTFNMFRPETRWWIIGPTYKLAEKEFRVVWDDFKALKLLDKCKSKNYNVNQGQMRLVTPWGSVLEAVSAEKPESLVGEGLNGVIMSEAAKHSMKTWQQIIEPALTDLRGSAIFPSTPQGFNWYKGLFDLGADPRFPDYESWRFPTWFNKYRYPDGYDDPELVRVRQNVSKAFWDQEYAADFTSFEGQIYPEWDEKLHVKPITYNPNWRNFQVFDFGYIDPFVCLDIMVDDEDNVYVWREYQVSYESTWTHANIIKNRANPPGFHVDGRFADPSGADAIATLELVLGYTEAKRVGETAGASGKEQGYEAIKRWLKPLEGPPKLFFDPSCQHIIRQMPQLHKKAVKEGQNEKPGQHDFDDHGPDALRYFFNHMFVLGYNLSLESVYTPSYRGSEAETFFTYTGGIELQDNIGYG